MLPTIAILIRSAPGRAVGSWAVAGFAALLGALPGLLGPSAPLGAQDANVLLPVDTIEARLGRGPLSIVHVRDTRFPGDRTQRVTLEYPDSSVLAVKWAAAPVGGEGFNNAPRYEVASYVLQKLFLPPEGHVVPPTVVRAVPLETARSVSPGSRPTFRGVASTLVVLQYWLSAVSPREVWDRERFASDSAYARHVANLNVFAYLARHSDSNLGNFLISIDPGNPRTFAVDNGLTFGSQESDRGHEWRSIRVPRIPGATAERLRALDAAELERALGVLAEWRIAGDALATVEPGSSLDPSRGIRRRGDRVQLGLTAREISGVRQRIRRLLELVDRGALGVF